MLQTQEKRKDEQFKLITCLSIYWIHNDLKSLTPRFIFTLYQGWERGNFFQQLVPQRRWKTSCPLRLSNPTLQLVSQRKTAVEVARKEEKQSTFRNVMRHLAASVNVTPTLQVDSRRRVASCSKKLLRVAGSLSRKQTTTN